MEAAKLANSIREQLAAGIDPLELHKQEKVVVLTFEEAARKVHAELLPGWKNDKHGKQWLSTLEKHVFPFIGSIKLDSLTAANIATALRPIWLSRSETARRTRQRIHTVMAWGWAHGYCSANPVDVVGHLLPQQTSANTRRVHQPAMPWRIIPLDLAAHINQEANFNVSEALLTYVILTACRSGEARYMRWSEVDLKVESGRFPPKKNEGGNITSSAIIKTGSCCARKDERLAQGSCFPLATQADHFIRHGTHLVFTKN